MTLDQAITLANTPGEIDLQVIKAMQVWAEECRNDEWRAWLNAGGAAWMIAHRPALNAALTLFRGSQLLRTDDEEVAQVMKIFNIHTQVREELVRDLGEALREEAP